MARYFVIDREMEETDPGFAEMVSLAYAQRARVLCLCRRDRELPLYTALRGESHVLARWPGTGARHAPHCDHYEAPDFLTGLGELRGSAILDSEDGGETALRFGFPLTRGAARAAPAALSNDKPDVKASGARLTMRGLLHYLWDRAELTHWHPRMAGKRNWYIVRRQLLQAAHHCTARGESLARVLFVPETFRSSEKQALAQRRHGELALAEASRDAIMIVIGEVKAIEADRYGEKILLRHLADWPLLMDADMTRRFHKRFALEEGLWRAAGEDGHLIMAASFSIQQNGLPSLYEVALMPVTPEWIPYEVLEDRALVASAVAAERRFVKGLRLNLSSERPIASLTLVDTGEDATAIHLARALPNPAYDEALARLMRTQGVAHAVWRSGDALPPPAWRGPHAGSARGSGEPN